LRKKESGQWAVGGGRWAVGDGRCETASGFVRLFMIPHSPSPSPLVSNPLSLINTPIRRGERLYYLENNLGDQDRDSEVL